MKKFSDTRRAVITGMGVIAPNGLTLKSFWKSVSSGRSAAGLLTRFAPDGGPCRLAAEIRNFDPLDYIDPKVAKRMDRSIQYAVAAAKLAVADSGINLKAIDPDRMGVVEATSLSNAETLYRGRVAYDIRGHRGITPTMVMSAYVGSGSAEVAYELGCKGHSISMSSSSASGNDVMGYALGMIQNEEIDVMVAGGAEAPLFDTGFAGFAHVRAMTRWKGEPSQAMKPFDKRGDGFVMGESAAFVVIEELSHALSRKAHIYAEILGHGRSCEAYHPMAPHPDGVGLVRAMEKAFRMAGCDPSIVDYVNVHGTANAPSDIAETRAIKKFFGSRAKKIAVSATKPITGHSLAASGALETVICALALQHQLIPPTLNLREPHEECDLDYVPDVARPYPVRSALNLSSGFGGKSSCLLLARYSL